MYYKLSVLGKSINDLLRKFKQGLETSTKEDPNEEEDRIKLIGMMEDVSKETLDVSILDRQNSVLIATAILLVKDHNLDTKSVNLDMPLAVQDNLKQFLLPYLNAVKLD